MLTQKTRNKPIAITDIAISKVPRTRIQGFTSEQNARVQELHKEVLQTAQELNQKYHNDEMEAAILLDLFDMNTYWKVEGKKPRRVRMKDNPEANTAMQTWNTNRFLLMHNHPSTGTFSAKDILTFCNTDSIYILTVIANNGTVYILRKGIHFDAVAFLNEYGDLIEQIGDCPNNATQAVKKLLKYAYKYDLYYKKGAARI
ncbi:MAG: hypothetical protein J5819_09120 [Eubacterium sp.]|nr:hypothetical protein [Eubacterium sp.]